LGLANLANRQYGVVGRWQLVELGFGDEAIRSQLRSGRLHQLHRSSYAVGHRIVPRRGKWLAAVLAMGPGAFLSHESAAALWGLVGDRPEVDVTAPGGRQERPGRKGMTVHRCKLHSDEVTVHERIPVSTVARTLFDLAERGPANRLKDAWDEASRLRLLRVPEVTTAYDRGRGRLRARRRIRPFLAARQRLVEDLASRLEDRFAAFVVDHRLPPPQTNVLVDGDEVDVLWPGARLIVELDSWEFHAHRAAFEKDRSRDADHLLDGYRTLRVTHRRLSEEPVRLAAQIQALLAASYSERRTSAAIAAVSVGLSPTRTPFASSASFFATAVPEEPEMIAPAWPICLPGGAVKPAM
jgi:very-short-patch-repair endonuclease